MSEFSAVAKYLWFGLVILLPVEAYSFQAKLPKQVMPQQINMRLMQPVGEHRLVVKFNDDLRARCVGGLVVSADKNATQFSAGLAAANNLQFRPLLKVDQANLDALVQKAADNSGRKQPDIGAMMVVDGAKEKLQQVALTLSDSQYVEWVEFEQLAVEPPVYLGDFDIAPVTQDYSSRQAYLGPNPGLNTLAFQAFSNSRGEGVKLADCEYWFHGGHEDLCDIFVEPSLTPHPDAIIRFDGAHGTASLGISVGADNGYGVRGISHEASGLFFPQWTVEQGFNPAFSIFNAISAVDPGDIVLLEMQTSLRPGNEAYGPAELSNSVWTATRLAFDMGVIVVAAAGNGNQNLDSDAYASYRSRGDSGAIIIGAGSADLGHNKLGFSTFGSRVNVQGWGRAVFTLGYGSFAQVGGSGDVNQCYTSTFSGTSSASAMLAGVCAALQSYSVAAIGRRLTPTEMRQALTETGHRQGSGGNIGPFPDMVQAAGYITSNFAPEFVLGDVNRDGSVGFLDVGPLVNLLASSTYQFEADVNGDGQVGFLDIGPFINLLSQVETTN